MAYICSAIKKYSESDSLRGASVNCSSRNGLFLCPDASYPFVRIGEKYLIRNKTVIHIKVLYTAVHPTISFSLRSELYFVIATDVTAVFPSKCYHKIQFRMKTNSMTVLSAPGQGLLSVANSWLAAPSSLYSEIMGTEVSHCAALGSLVSSLSVTAGLLITSLMDEPSWGWVAFCALLALVCIVPMFNIISKEE